MLRLKMIGFVGGVFAFLAVGTAAFAQSLPSCSTFTMWKRGDECVNTAGKTCKVMNVRNGKLELNCATVK
jgi:hypothetical protein